MPGSSVPHLPWPRFVYLLDFSPSAASPDICVGGGGGPGAGLVLGAAVGGFLLLVVSLSVCYAKKWACFAVGTLYYLLKIIPQISTVECIYYINLHNKYLEKAGGLLIVKSMH